jgi:DNA-directed RNA polymerase sigma subunit (sigma70/sigma32)
VGQNLGITRERVRQLEARALRELRAIAPGLELYLRS